MEKKQEIVQVLGGALRNIFQEVEQQLFESIEEIRIRVGQPLLLRKDKKDYFININGKITPMKEKAYHPISADIQSTIALLSHYSFYAFEEEARQGFITIEGGHRIGFAGKTVLENGYIKTIKDISSLNFRIAHAFPGCADKIIKYIVPQGKVVHTLFVSPPGCGKTTLLRDVIRQLSSGIEGIFEGCTVGVADERGEIAGCYKGVAQNDVGPRTDILDCCPKAQGMLMLLRSMSPQVIAVDEIGKKEDFEAVESILHAGIKLLCTVHGNHLEDIQRRPILGKLVQDGVFDTIIVLSGTQKTGQVEAVYNRELEQLY